VIGAVGGLFDRQSAAHQRLRFRQAVRGLQQLRQVVEDYGHSWVIGAVGGLIMESAALAGGVTAARGPCLADHGGEDVFGGCSGLR
jgi:hypothetical protein